MVHAHSAEDTAAMFIQRAHRLKASKKRAKSTVLKLAAMFRLGKLRAENISPMKGEAELIRKVTQVQNLYRSKRAREELEYRRAERAATRIADEQNAVNSMARWWSCNTDDAASQPKQDRRASFDSSAEHRASSEPPSNRTLALARQFTRPSSPTKGKGKTVEKKLEDLTTTV